MKIFVGNQTTILSTKTGSGPHTCEGHKGTHKYAHNAVVWVSFLCAPSSSGRFEITAVTVAQFIPNTQGGRGRAPLPNHAFLVGVHQHTLEFPRECNWLTWGRGVPLLDPPLWAVDSHGLFILWGLLISQERETHTCLTRTKLHFFQL